MSIGSPPPPDEAPRSTLRIGGSLLIVALLVVGAIAWKTLRSNVAAPTVAAPASDPHAKAIAPHQPPDEDPSFAQRLFAAAAAARRPVAITAHVAQESRDLVRSLELIGGFAPPPTARPGEAATLASA